MEQPKQNKIAIVGGGISGLSTLHWLLKKNPSLSPNDVVLYESSCKVGGKIHSDVLNQSIFEWGPNGFLNNQPETLRLIEDIGLTGKLIEADLANNKRYISIDKKLYEIPNSIKTFLKFPKISIGGKLCFIKDLFSKPQLNSSESIYEFGCRHFGKEITETFIDPMILGIYAGDIRTLSIAHCLPKIFQLERDHDSIIKGMLKLRNNQHHNKKKLLSFQNGMSEIINALYQRYQAYIQLDSGINSVAKSEDGFKLSLNGGQIRCLKELIMTTPAYINAKIFESNFPNLSDIFKDFYYNSIGVIGLSYSKNKKFKIPNGYGYLIPSRFNSPILGVLFEHDIWSDRAIKDHVFLRFMIKLTDKDASNLKKDYFLNLALKEVEDVFDITDSPESTFFKYWSEAIPQYDLNYSNRIDALQNALAAIGHISVCGNYFDGVSMNDCISNAKRVAERVLL